MQRKVIATGAVALAIGVAGCGSSGPLTKAEFTKQANGVCNRALARNRHEDGKKEIVQQVVLMQRAKVAGMASITPPDELKTRFDAYTRFLAVRGRLLEQARAAMQANNLTKELEKQVIPTEGHERKLAAALGLIDCRYHA